MTIRTILGFCEQCGSWTTIFVIVVRENRNEACSRCYCEKCLGERGVSPGSPFIDIATAGEEF